MTHFLTLEGLVKLMKDNDNSFNFNGFKREFKNLYHYTPANYIKNKRLKKAAALLLISEERITDIAFDCGFNDLSNFTRSFHEKYHVAPSQYLNRPTFFIKSYSDNAPSA